MALFTADAHFVVYMNAKDPTPSQEPHSCEALEKAGGLHPTRSEGPGRLREAHVKARVNRNPSAFLRDGSCLSRGRSPTSRGEALPCRAQALVDRSETLVPLVIRVPSAAR